MRDQHASYTLQEEGLVALSIVQKLVPRSMVNPIASISSQPLPCVQQKVLMLQKRVKELEATDSSNDVPMLVLSNSTCFRGILALVSLGMVHVGAFRVRFLY